MRAWMAGRLRVRDFELRPRGINLAQRGEQMQLDVSVGSGGTLLGMPYDEAVKAFRAREIVSREVFDARDRAARQRSFMATRLTSETVLQAAQDSLATHLESGGTFQGFADAIEAEDASFGISGQHRGYLQTVFNTNVASAYGVGRLEELSSPAAVEAMPYRQYRATEDGGENAGGRTRESHLALNLKLWRADDLEWMRFAPPTSYQCRCEMIAIETAEEAQGDIATLLAMPAVHPDPSFAGVSLTL